MTRISVYLPKEASGYADASENIETRMCDAFGGFTAYDARGGWKAPDGDIVREPVTVYESFTDMKAHQAYQAAQAAAHAVATLTDETAVMYTVDGECHMVEA